MSDTLHVLLVEDDADDAELLTRQLRHGGYEPSVHRVDTVSALEQALEHRDWDVVLSDHKLPQFTSAEALRLVRDRGMDVPFIIVSGNIGEEAAVDALRAGANDYVLKDRLARLVPAIARAIDERVLRQQQTQQAELLRNAQRMESIGRLAGGVAHDFNNMLTAILGRCENLIGHMAEGDPNGDDIRAIYKTASRGALVTRQLLAFSRQQVLAPQDLDLAALVKELEPLVRTLVGDRIVLTVSTSTEPAVAHADRALIRQALLNLVGNARDAMPEGGKLEIAVGVDVIGDASNSLPPGEYVALSVKDDGTGIDARVLPRIFDPFFTTKPVGSGSGLGLAMVHGFVSQSGGDVRALSEAGKGSTFVIRLPRSLSAPAPSPSVSVPGPVAFLPSVIIVVDDNDAVREVVSGWLRHAGHVVHEAPSGERAIEIHESMGQRTDVLVTDLSMPVMTGKELADTLAGLQPDLKVLYISGYMEEWSLQGPARMCLTKPFNKEALCTAVASLLAGS